MTRAQRVVILIGLIAAGVCVAGCGRRESVPRHSADSDSVAHPGTQWVGTWRSRDVVLVLKEDGTGQLRIGDLSDTLTWRDCLKAMVCVEITLDHGMGGTGGPKRLEGTPRDGGLYLVGLDAGFGLRYVILKKQ